MGNDGKPTDYQRQLFGIPTIDDGKISLYASPKTSVRINGMRDQIADLTKADTAFVTIEDFQKTAKAPNEGRNLKAHLQNILPKDVFKGVFGDMNGQDWAETAQAMRNPLARRIDLNSDGRADFGLISLGRLNETKEESISDLTHIKKSKLRNIPGTDADYQDYTTLHEARHIGQPIHNAIPVLAHEKDADHSALRGIKRDGAPFNSETVEMITLSRATGALTGPGSQIDVLSCSIDTLKKYCALPTHSTHLALSGHVHEGLPMLDTAANQAEWNGMLQTKGIVNATKGLLDVQQEFRDLQQNKNFSDPEKYLRLADTMSVMNNPLKTAARGAMLSHYDVIGSKAVVDALRDTPVMQTPGIQSYLNRVDAFFDKHVPDYKTQPEYLKDQPTLQKLAEGMQSFTPRLELTPKPAPVPGFHSPATP